MKLLKYLAIPLIILAIVAGLVTYQRESIIRDLANSALRDYGLTVSDLSIDTLAADHVFLSRLVLEQDDATRYQLTNVSFPLSLPSFHTENIAIGELLMVPAQPSNEPPQISSLLQTFLDLPLNLPNTTVTLSRYSTADMPPLDNIVWRSDTSREFLAFAINKIAVNVDVEPSGDDRHRATVSAAVDGGADTLAMQLDILRADSGFAVQGPARIGLLPWLPLLHALDILPAELIALDADLEGPVSIVIDDDADKPLRLNAELAVAGRRSVAYRVSADTIIQVTATEADLVELWLDYPSMEWNATNRQSDIMLKVAGLGEARGRLSDLSCHSGIRCTLRAALDSETLKTGPTSVSSAAFSGTLTATTGENSLFEFASDTALALNTVASGNVLARKLNAAVADGVRLVVDNDGWTADVRKLKVNIDALTDGDISLGGTSFATTLKVTSGDDIRIAVAPDSSLAISKLASGNLRAKSLNVAGFRGTSLQIDDQSWQADIEKLDVRLDDISNGDGLVATLPLSFDKIRLRDAASNIRMAFSMPPKAASIHWNDAVIVAPSISGTATLRDHTLSTTLEVSGDKNSASARINALHHLNSGQGSVALTDAALRFDSQKLSGWMKKWPYPWDLVAGSWNASADINWDSSAEGLRTRGTIMLRAEGLAGFYNDIAFTGMNTRVSATLDPEKGMEVIPASITVALLDVGIPIQDITADFTVDIPDQQLSVRKLEMATLGGSIKADPFDYSLQKPVNNIMLRPQSVQLQFMIDIAEFKDVQLSGSLSGRIPVSMSEKGITVADGRLESDAPGVIRYQAGAAVAAGNSEIGLVSRALDNFQYDSLTSDVNYNEAGDLKLKMRMSGINPDMDARQPVILNLGVENNIPQLLRSLRATRAIEDVLQRKANK